jgi:acetyl esterase
VAIPWRVRLLGAMVARATGPVAAMTPVRREALRAQSAPRLVTAFLNGVRARGVTTTDCAVPTPDGPVRIRVYRPPGWTPESRLPVVVAFHGGGWVFGNLDSADWLCSQVAARVGAVVVAVAYRLAPEHPAPAAHRDACAVTAWVAEHAAELGARSDRLAVLGESSGATLAATVALAARDLGGPSIRLQVLLYPITDLTLSSRSIAQLPDEPILRSADLHAYVRLYLGGTADGADPYVSPLLAREHRGLPPALVMTADHDPLRDDGRRYVQRLAAAGVPVQHLEYADSPHGFFSFPRICRAAGPALDALTAALHRALLTDPRSEMVASPGQSDQGRHYTDAAQWGLRR